MYTRMYTAYIHMYGGPQYYPPDFCDMQEPTFTSATSGSALHWSRETNIHVLKLVAGYFLIGLGTGVIR